jgi:hypothetical protein
MALRTVVSELVPEKCSFYYSGYLKDEEGNAIVAADLTTLTVTVYDETTGTIINGVENTNILNTGRGSIDAAGLLEVVLLPADMAVVGTGKRETHILLIQWTWATGSKAGKKEVAFPVQNLTKVS